MSTSLLVVPSSRRIPTVGELSGALRDVLLASVRHPVARRAFVGLDPQEAPLVELVRERRPSRLEATNSDATLPLSMGGFDYGWISLHSLRVGFDFAFEEDDDLHEEWVRLECAHRAAVLGTARDFDFEGAAAAGHSWTLRMQAMQPLAARLLGGLAAAALAHLVDGVVHSYDGGADYDRTPETPERFLEWYPDWIEAQLAQAVSAQSRFPDTSS